MSNNITVLDYSGTQKTLQATDVGGGVLVPNSLPTDGTNAFKSASGTNLAAQTGINAMMTALPGQWSVTNAPAINTQATASKSAGAAGVRHVCTGLTCTLAQDATGSVQLGILFNLRDGATGAGTILASFTLSCAATAGQCTVLSISGLNIPGSAATAMTLENAGTPATHTAASVALFGYDVSG